MGKQALGESNVSRECLVELCANYSLVIGGSLYPHTECHKVTWVSPDNDTESQMDHLTVSRQWKSSLCNARNRRGADRGSGNHLVVGGIKLKIATINKLNQSRRSRFDTRKLNDTKTAGSLDYS
jgi:hypothetical protein